MPDEEQFEKYLKEFRPLLLDPLPIGRHEVSPRYRGMWAAGAVALIVLTIASSWMVQRRNAEGQRRQAAVKSDLSLQPVTQPLTMGEGECAAGGSSVVQGSAR